MASKFEATLGSLKLYLNKKKKQNQEKHEVYVKFNEISQSEDIYMIIIWIETWVPARDTWSTQFLSLPSGSTPVAER